MTLEEIRKNAWSLRLDERPPGDCIASEVTDENAYFYYGPDEEGKYRYRSATDLYYMQKKKKRKEAESLINIYIDTNFKGTKGNVEYGFFMEWVNNGTTMNEPNKDFSNIVFGSVKDTRNRAFLRAAIEAVGKISENWMVRDPQAVTIYSTCEYLATSMQKRLPEQWILHGWIKGDGKEVKNRDLWIKLLDVIKEKHIEDIEWKNGPHKLSELIYRGIERQYERPIPEEL